MLRSPYRPLRFVRPFLCYFLFLDFFLDNLLRCNYKNFAMCPSFLVANRVVVEIFFSVVSEVVTEFFSSFKSGCFFSQK
jgi:hypothetical protein